ncbi:MULTISPECIES: hypothetical protein [Streptomyces]|uniref:hypothetical protein n=1 Tax=Streptomyces TaxID=1883 RepID=UPI000C2764F8|nr:hypothetical protein [Streptomyces sp. CB02120-2]PJN19286.1 hypothetical protein CG724_11080 [Streptomyces sp. CB02120-2]
MTHIPDAVAVASLDTHRLIITVPNSGPADVRSNLPQATAAAILRHLAAELDDEQPLAALPGEARAILAAKLAHHYSRPAADMHAADALAHHARELSNMLDAALDAALDRGEPSAAPLIGRHLVSMLRSYAVRLDTAPRTSVDDLLDHVEARIARQPRR